MEGRIGPREDTNLRSEKRMRVYLMDALIACSEMTAFNRLYSASRNTLESNSLTVKYGRGLEARRKTFTDRSSVMKNSVPEIKLTISRVGGG